MNLSRDGASSKILDDFTLYEVQALADENPSLRGFLQGYLAEAKLRQEISSISEVGSVSKIPDSSRQKGDLLVSYLGHTISIECKSLRLGSLDYCPLAEAWEAGVRCKSTDSRLVKDLQGNTVRTLSLDKGCFDVLALCTFPANGRWQFLFLDNLLLPEPKGLPGMVSNSFRINTKTTPGLFFDVRTALDFVLLRKLKSFC